MRRKHFNDLNGKKFGRLTVLEEAKPRWSGIIKRCKIIMWLCECECGTRKIISGGNLRSGSIVSCGCYSKEIRGKIMRKYYDKKTPNSIEKDYYRSYLTDARKNNRKFKLSFKEFLNMINDNCHYCGSTPSLIRYNKNKTKEKLVNGIDRIDSTTGYTKKNTVTCCTKCNLMKNIYSADDFLKHVKKINNHHPA